MKYSELLFYNLLKHSIEGTLGYLDAHISEINTEAGNTLRGKLLINLNPFYFDRSLLCRFSP